MSDTQQFASRAEESRFLRLRLEKLERSNAELVRALQLIIKSITLAGEPELARDEYCLGIALVALKIARANIVTAKGEA